MKEKEVDKVIAFDTLFTNNRIQMFKILLSYLQPAAQRKFAIYIKFMELQYTISFFQNHPLAALRELPHEESMNTGHFLEEVIPFCDTTQRENLNRIKGILQNLENMQEMMETLQMMKELFPEGIGSNDGCDMSQLLSMFGGGDMSGMFDMFCNGFSSSGKDESPAS